MDRRRFLCTGAAASALAMSGWPLGHALGYNERAGRLRLLRLDEDTARFLPHRVALYEGAGDAPLRLRFQATQPAARGGFDELRVDALYATASAPWRFRAWHYRRGDAFGSSRASGFLLPRHGLHGLALDWREGADWFHETLAFGPGTALVPGRYLLATTPVGGWSGLAYSGDPERPLQGPTSFDALAFIVEPAAADIEEPLRADLACLQAEADGCS